MPYLPDLNTYLHQSSLLLTAYPSSRITTKYSLPRKPKPRKPKPSPPTAIAPPDTTTAPTAPPREKREPSATLTLKTYHPETGICLKYKTDKAQEVGRLMNGLGRLARGEEIEMATSGGAEKMDVDGGGQVAVKEDDRAVVGRPSEGQTQQTQQMPAQGGGGAGGGGGGGKKKKKGKGK